jgi:hypothetical protein
MTTPRLKRCAHCGKTARILGFASVRVICTDCFISTDTYGKESAAIRAWNRRWKPKRKVKK